MITVELPDNSMIFMETNTFETYSKKAGRGVPFPKINVSKIIGYTLITNEDMDIALGSIRHPGFL